MIINVLMEKKKKEIYIRGKIGLSEKNSIYEMYHIFPWSFDKICFFTRTFHEIRIFFYLIDEINYFSAINLQNS